MSGDGAAMPTPTPWPPTHPHALLREITVLSVAIFGACFIPPTFCLVINYFSNTFYCACISFYYFFSPKHFIFFLSVLNMC